MSAKITYLGGMCIHIERSDGFKIIVDPYLNDNHATTARAEDYYDVDLILVTHYAFDHFGDTIEIFQNSNAKLVACSDTLFHFRRQHAYRGDRLINTIYGDMKEFGQTIVRTVRAFHISRGEVDGIQVFGPPLGFVIRIEPGVTYYHTGDTCLYSDMKLLRELYKPNIMCVGISRIKESSSCEMTPREAAMATSWIGPDVVIPTHYPVNDTAALSSFRRHMESFAPDVIIKSDIGKPFAYTPAKVE